MSSSQTAILVFSHRPEREWQNKQLVRKDRSKSRAVADALYRHTLQSVEASGLPVLPVTDERQRGDGFGPRLANAVADAFADGYDRVIVVGSDCPRLHEVNWTEVVAHLDAGRPVLGPTPGQAGAYLIGLTRVHFEADAFAQLPWQSPALFEALERHLAGRAGTASARLDPRDDVNSHDELVALVRRSIAGVVGLAAVLRRILGRAVAAGVTGRPADRHVLGSDRSRAPPARLGAFADR